MKLKRIGTILIALLIAFTGCAKNEANVSETENTTDVNITVIEDELPEEVVTEDTDVEDDELNESDIFRWDNLELDNASSMRKLVTTDADSFEEDFISQYVEDIPDGCEIISVSGYSVMEYFVGDNNTIYVIKEPRDDGEMVTCIYVDDNEATQYEGLDLELTNFPVEGDADYQFATVVNEDYTVVTYEDIVDSFTDEGTRYYDADGHLIVWDYYCTSGCRQIYILWQGDEIYRIIATGGMASTGDEENPEISLGIYTVIYTFTDPVSFEELEF